MIVVKSYNSFHHHHLSLESYVLIDLHIQSASHTRIDFPEHMDSAVAAAVVVVIENQKKIGT